MTTRFAEETIPAATPGSLISGPSLPGHSVQRNEQQHTFLIDQHLIACTTTEYRLLALLLEQAERYVPYARLIEQFHEGTLTDVTLRQRARSKLMHLISDLRAKIWVCGLDIANVMGVGYLLLDCQADEMTPLAGEQQGDRRAR